MRNVIGIDLGTTYSCVAVFKDGHVEIIANEDGKRTIPSIVAFTEHERLVGDPAKSQAGVNAKNTIYDAKRLIGRKYNDKHLQEDQERWPFKIVDNQDRTPRIEVQFKGKIHQFRPEEISAMILEKMKQIAEDYTGKIVDGAVITVPAYFNNAQRQATKHAAEIAKLNVMRILNEPTAAAIAYGFQSKEEDSRTILVIDLGGGTFDVTLLKIEDDVYEVLATAGDTHLGGEDFDNRLVVHCVKDICTQFGIDITNNKKAMCRLRMACEDAKRALTTAEVTSIDLDSLFDNTDYKIILTRQLFETLNGSLFDKLMEPVYTALKDADLNESDFMDIVLIGGSTRIPKIQQLIKEKFPKCKINKDINPDEAVAHGAAIQAAKLGGEEVCEALQEMALLDVTPLSLGIETVGGMMSVIIPRNTTVPVTKTKMFTTYKDNQTSVRVQVYEGERLLTKDNNVLGDFRLTGIRLARARTLEIEVAFNVDSNGILTVSAKEQRDNKENTIDIQNMMETLTDEAIQIMIKKAEELRLDDDRERKRIQARVNLESLCFRYQSELRRPAAKKVAGSERESVFTKVATMLSWIDANIGNSKEDYEERYKEVHDFCEPIRQKIYRQDTECVEEEEETFDYEAVD